MNKLSLLFCILCAVYVPQMATASDHDLENALNQQFKNKILVLRHPDGHESLRYDADGKPLNRGQEGAWTIYGAVMVQKVELTGSKLHLQGRRLYVRRAASGLSTFEFQRARANEITPVSSSVKVEISTDQPVTTVEQAQALLGAVFALNKDDLLDSVPEFWRGYLAGYFNDYDFRQGKEMDFKAGEPGKKNGSVVPPPAKQETVYSGPTIYHIGQDVKAPKPKITPEPEFSEAARFERFSGVLVVAMVVDPTGKVSRVRVVRPLGLGLDESAVAMIKTWSFEPAVREGQPVAVEMNVEVSFHLK